MCGICGCSDENAMHHSHANHQHIHLEQSLLEENQNYAKQNQAYLEKNDILALNLMSSPGSGKTTLLSKTIQELNLSRPVTVIVGDQQTELDAHAIQASGGQAIQINTGQVCHLDAHRIGHVIEELNLPKHSLLFIENIGNLVCPALFDLGEKAKVVMLSVTEGDNKPLKYPTMFHAADLLLITKIDLLPYVDFKLEACIKHAKQVNPNLQVLALSSKTGEGLAAWYDWIKRA